MPPEEEEGISQNGPNMKDQAEAFQVAASQYREATEALRRRRLSREANLSPDRPGEDTLRKLDSSVKRNTALVKKLRQVSEETVAGLQDEIRRTNQTKYVSEAVTAIADANLKPKDVGAAIQVACLLHQRYADFGADLAAALVHGLTAAAKGLADEEKVSMGKRRGWLRMLAELQALGVAGDGKTLLAVLGGLAKTASGVEREAAQAALTLLAAFAKAGREEFLGLPVKPPPVPSDLKEDPAIPAQVLEAKEELSRLQEAYREESAQQFSVPKEHQDQLKQLVEGAFEAACRLLVREHASLLDIEQHNLRALNNRGELPEEMSAQYEAHRKAFDGLQRAAASLSETLGQPLPPLQASGTTRLTNTAGGISVISGKEADDLSAGPFEDEETRSFYETLPDIRALVPAVLLGKGQEEAGTDAADQPTGIDDLQSSADAAAEAADGTTLDKAVEGKRGDTAADESIKADTSGTEVRAEVEALLRRLPDCTSTEAADELAVNFCYVNSKGASKRLVKALLDSSTTSVQQLPEFSRIIASLSSVFPDIGVQVMRSLSDDFAALQARRDPTQRTLEARLRTARFLGELTKFRICPPPTFFTSLKTLLDDFSGHNIDTSAMLVETAGRFLIRVPETQQRMSNMLEVMMKLKNSRNVDSRQSLAVDSAYIACRPPERASLARSRHPPHHLYMRHLIYNCLSHDETKHVTRKLRRFSWKENEAYLVRCLLSAVKGRYAHIPLLASLAASLAKYHPTLAVALPDALLEEVQVGLENPDSGAYQRRVGHMRLLGELYNYRLVDSRTIFETLYLLLNFGHESPEAAEKLDPPLNFFRIRLVCVLLSTCGHYFSRGTSGQRLNRFLIYFQQYMLCRVPLPLDVEFDVQDLLEQLRPGLVRLQSFENACQAVSELEAREAAQATLEPATADDSDSERGNADGASVSDDEGGGEQIGEAGDDESEAGPPSLDAEEEEQVRLLQPIDSGRQEVDEDFERELAVLSGRSLDTTSAATAPPHAQRSTPSISGGGTVSFQVMLRRGGRDDKSRAVEVPITSGLAVSAQQEAATQSAERAEMKRLVLEASHRDAAAEAGSTYADAFQAVGSAAVRTDGVGRARGGREGGRGRRHGGEAAGAPGRGGAGASRGRGRRYSASGTG